MPGGNRLKLKRQHNPKHVQVKIAKSQNKSESQEPAKEDVDLVEEAEKKEDGITAENESTVHISGNAIIDENGEKVEFEDEYGDDEEEEVVDGKYVVEAKTDEDYENGVVDEEEEDEDEDGEKDPLDMSDLKKNLPKKTVYLPSDGLDPEDELEYDPSAYDLLYRFTLDWPSLSFDFIKDNLGAMRETVWFFVCVCFYSM